MSDQTSQPKVPMRRSLRVLLFISLAVNLIVVGLVAGSAFGNRGQGADHAPRNADFMGAYTRALSDQDRRAIGRAIRDHHRKSGFSREAVRQEFQAMLSLLRATPFDSEAMGARLSTISQGAFERRQAAQTIWLERLAAMTDAERQDYADQIEAQLKRKPRSGKPPAEGR